MRRPQVVASLLATALALGTAACAVPQERDDDAVVKRAATPAEVDTVFERYRAVRAAAVRLEDAKVLSIVESGAVLDVDSGSFELAQRLSEESEQVDEPVDVEQVLSPRFGAYPLWFVAVVRDEQREVNRVQVFEREGAADPWLLVATPEIVLDAELPAVRERDGAAQRVGPDEDAGTALSAQEAADAYAAVLQDPEAEQASLFEPDGFMEQVRAAAAQNEGLEGVGYSQDWSSEPVRHALRTADGGVLAFVDLSRSDSYEVEEGVTVTWPESSPQQAFIPQGISTSGSLQYRHQVLMMIPPGQGEARVVGQFGGVVGAEGF